MMVLANDKGEPKMAATNDKRKTDNVGRVDFRLLMANKSATFGDKRTKRVRTRNSAERQAIRENLDY
jgi:hypothetical protein